MAEIGRGILKSALARATAGSEGARFIGAQLAGVVGSNVQTILESLKTLIDSKVASDDTRLGDQRTPKDLSVTNAKVADAAAIAESKLALASDAVPTTASRRTLGTGAQQAAPGNDTRFHARSHKLFSADHTDLNAADVPAGGEVLTFNGTSGLWEAAAAGGASATQATETALGVAELATQIETNAGTDDLRIVTPAKLANRTAIGSFRAFQSTAQLDIASVTWTKVLFQTEDWDASAWFDPVASRYIPQRAGVYALAACVGINPAVDVKYVTAAVYKNGFEYARLGQSHTGSTVAMLVTGPAEVVANGTTDYFEIYVQHNFGVNTSDLLADTKFTFFTGHYVGAAA